MVKIDFDNNPEIIVDRISDIVEEIKSILLDTKEVIIDISSIEKIDTAGIQVFLSLQKLAKKSDITLNYEGSLQSSIEDFCKEIGLKEEEIFN